MRRFVFSRTLTAMVMASPLCMPLTAGAINLENARAHLSKCAKSLQFVSDLLQTRLLHRRIYARRYSGHELIQKHINYLRQLPKRDLRGNALAETFLASHKVYVSVTTSPKRIGNLRLVLDTIDLEHVEKIYVAVPRVFERDGSTYEIPYNLRSHPKVEILHVETDYGPITKLLPAIEKVGAKDPDALVITIDDDTGYPRGMINEMIYWSTYFDGAAVGAAGRDFSAFNIPPKPAHLSKFQTVNIGNSEAMPVDVIEGYGAVGYRPSMVDVELMKQWSTGCETCRISDDLIISLALAKHGVPRYRTWSPYANMVNTIQFRYGFEADAIHRGGAYNKGRMEPTNITHLNYQQAYASLFGTNF